MPQGERTKKLDHMLAAPMFCLSLLLLLLLACLLHIPEELEYSEEVVWWCLVGSAILYPLFLVETALHLVAGSRHMRQHLWICLIPVLRIGAKDHQTGQELWLPKLGWQETNRPLVGMLSRAFSIPMILVALCVLPVIIIEFFWQDFVRSNESWQFALRVTMALIWAAFTFEFIVMMAVVDKKLRYATTHWIDVAVILLPMIELIRTFRLTQLVRLKQLSKTARIYRLRGLSLRMWRGFVALEFIDKVLSRNPERRLGKLESLLEEKLHELGSLRDEIERMKKRVADKKAKILAEQENLMADTTQEQEESAKKATATDDEPGNDSEEGFKFSNLL